MVVAAAAAAAAEGHQHLHRDGNALADRPMGNAIIAPEDASSLFALSRFQIAVFAQRGRIRISHPQLRTIVRKASKAAAATTPARRHEPPPGPPPTHRRGVMMVPQPRCIDVAYCCNSKFTQ